jgi:tRNA nucleotidyltransferase/poly(A) polymerase
MFSRGNIHRLDRHLQTVRDAAQQEVFLVGGCVRDVLCGWTENPTDVDSTAAGDPAQIYAHFQAQAEKYIGLFRTEKYGTMTMIQESDYGNISYELTPFREE